ncbi:ArsR/SmtB family transcription factor [Acinetobacter sp. KB005]|uniref:ArsR/SmtB family transcription factor n=1 Tax=Acinetobacter sp. KB005 TaxID=3416667 RepID=UPI003CEF086D
MNTLWTKFPHPNPNKKYSSNRFLSSGLLGSKRVSLSQSSLSQHLAKMREEGLVAYRRESQTLYYRIENPDIAKIIALLKSIFQS